MRRQQIEQASDSELYGAAVAGDRNAVSGLVERHHQQLVAYGAANGWAQPDCEDAAQTAWIRFFQHVQQASEDPAKALEKPESLRFWLLKTTLNALRQEHRSVRRRDALQEKMTADGNVGGRLVDDPDYLERLEQEERRSALRSAFFELGTLCHELIGLLLVDPPLGYDEVSEQLGRPKVSIGPTRRRCIDQLITLI